MPRIRRRTAALLIAGVLLVLLAAGALALSRSGSQQPAAAPADGLPAPASCDTTVHAMKTLSSATPLPSVGHTIAIGRPSRVGSALVAHYSVAPIGRAEYVCYRRRLQTVFPATNQLPVNLPGMIGTTSAPGPVDGCRTRCLVAVGLSYSQQTKVLQVTEAVYPGMPG